jgi:hypothetical protein
MRKFSIGSLLLLQLALTPLCISYLLIKQSEVAPQAWFLLLAGAYASILLVVTALRTSSSGRSITYRSIFTGAFYGFLFFALAGGPYFAFEVCTGRVGSTLEQAIDYAVTEVAQSLVLGAFLGGAFGGLVGLVFDRLNARR